MAGSLSRAGAVKEGVVVGTAAAAIMREGTGTTLTARELVEVETDLGLSARFSAGQGNPRLGGTGWSTQNNVA